MGNGIPHLDNKKPTYELEQVKKMIVGNRIIPPKWRVIQSANELGFSETDAYDEILKLERSDFCKSTNEYYNHDIWLDVYKKTIKGKPMYVKFKLTNEGFLLSSFKLDESDK